MGKPASCMFRPFASRVWRQRAEDPTGASADQLGSERRFAGKWQAIWAADAPETTFEISLESEYRYPTGSTTTSMLMNCL